MGGIGIRKAAWGTALAGNLVRGKKVTNRSNESTQILSLGDAVYLIGLIFLVIYSLKPGYRILKQVRHQHKSKRQVRTPISG